MKTICILSYERTGSTWLCTALNTAQTWCAFEIFSRNPSLFYWNFLTLLKKNQSLPNPIVECFQKIFHPQNLFIDVNSFNKIKQNMLATKPFSMDLLESLKQEAYSQNKNFCFKIFPEHFDENISFDMVINACDYIIINYRNNILETFLSWKLALKSGAWTSMDKKDTSIDTDKILWSEDQYLPFYEKVKNTLETWESLLCNREYVLLDYDKIHSYKTNEEKSRYVRDILHNSGLFDIDVSPINRFSKQVDYSDKTKLILNIKDFENSLNKNIPIYYKAGYNTL